MAINLSDNIKTSAPKPTDSRYLNVTSPYSSTTEVNSSVVSGVRYTGLTVNINGVEYWYKDGIGDGDLVEKTTGGGTGGITMSGTTVSGLTTYVDSDTICAQPNLTFNGSNLGVTGDITATGDITGNNLSGTNTGDQATNLTPSQGTTSVTIASSTGTNATINAATTTTAGVMTCADKSKLDGIEAGAEVNVATNLSNTTTTTTVTVISSTGTNTTIPAATTSLAGLMTCADKVKLNGIEAGAEVNDATNLGTSHGTTSVTITSSTGTNATINAASSTAAGVVTNGTQTFGGAKTTSIWCGTTCVRGGCLYSTGNIYGVTTCGAAAVCAGSTSRSANNYMRVLAGDSYTAGFEAYGASQGTGYVYVGQSSSYGGGMFYNGDGTPAFADGEASDRIGFYRMTSGAKTVVFDYSHASNDVSFKGNVAASGCFVGSGAGLTGTASSLTVGSATSANNSTCLGGATAAAYLRSNVADVKTAGNLRFDDSVCLTFGTGNDLTMLHNGSHAYISTATGNLNLRVAGSESTLVGVANSCTILYYNSSERFKTITNGACIFGCGYATDFIASSDIRLKNNITPITSALSKVDALCGVCYNFCEDDTLDMGLIAQDVEKIEPRLVTKGEPTEDDIKKYNITDKKYGLKYDKFAGLFVEAIKELKEQNICLQNQIIELRKKIN